jgi:uncharacterized protein YndB with AHSA1/START domain
MAARLNPAAAPAAAPAERVLLITRLLDAPRRLVFKAWTEPEHVVRWWGCAGSTVTTFKRDLRPGGEYRVLMRLDDGTDHRVRGVYREIVEPERLVFTWAWEDAAGHLGHETLVTVTLVERGGKTEMTLRHAVFESTDMRDLHGLGWNASFDRLVAYLAGGASGASAAR